MDRRLLVVPVLILGVWTWGAIGTLAGPAPAPGPLQVTVTDMSFSPNRIDVRVGRPVEIRISNGTQERHDLAFASAHMEATRGAQAILEPGQTQTLRLAFDTPGVHRFSCSIHGPTLMSGAVFVSA